MSRLTQQLVATLLAAVFAVVGCTGEALYYLVEADFEQSVQAEAHSHDGFHHHHGDGLWHHHGPTPSSAATAKAKPTTRLLAAEGKPAIREEATAHQWHTCLTLALVSEFEQSLTSTSEAICSSERTSNYDEAADDHATSLPQPTLGARGPPLHAV